MRVIAYYRVSTKRQGESGLGLEAQQHAVEAFARASNAVIDAAYTEVESGKRADRPKLAAALAHAKRNRATVLIAKLDRLGRNVAFLSAMMEAGVDFICVDDPNMNKFTCHIRAAMAEEEARQISARTKAGLAAAKRRGTLLGSDRPGHWEGRELQRMNGLAKATARAAIVRHDNALKAVADLMPEMLRLRLAGESLRDIATALNTGGHRTTRGNLWTAMGIKLAMERAGQK